MKKIIYYLVGLLLVVWVGVMAHDHPGYVLISLQGITIESSLWLVVLGLFGLFGLFYAILRLGHVLGSISSSLRNWLGNRRRRRAHSQTILGFYDLLEGNWAKAEKRLAKVAARSEIPVINYLAAAFSAHQQGVIRRSYRYLAAAEKLNLHGGIVNLARAQLGIANHHLEEASEILQQLRQLQPKNGLVLRLLQQVYHQRGQWSPLADLLPLLRKRQILNDPELRQLELETYGELLKQAIHKGNLRTTWKKLSRSLRHEPKLVAIFVEQLLIEAQDDEAEQILKMVIRKHFDDRLLELYAQIKSTLPIKHLNRAEQWLDRQPHNHNLLLCLGRICRQQQLWGKARHYLELSIKNAPTVGAYVELGEIMQQQGEAVAAIELYRKALMLYSSPPGVSRRPPVRTAQVR